MRVGIFYQANDSEFASTILKKFSRQGLIGTAYKMGGSWEQIDGQEMSFIFSNISHFIIIPCEQSFTSRWLPFIAGFGIGGDKTVCLFLRQPGMIIPSYLSVARIFTETDKLELFVKDEANIWDKTKQIERAREALITLGLGINEENLAQRVTMGDIESVINFIHIGYSPDCVNNQGVPLICLATRNGHREIIKLLLEKGGDINLISLDRGNSPLMEAAVKGDDISVRLFLEAGANPDLVSKSGQTALMLAIGEGHDNVVSLLMEYHADIEIKDNLGMTAKKYAEIFRNERIMALLNPI